MTHAQIVRTYTDKTLAGIIRDLGRNGQWQSRYLAAIQEKTRRQITKKPNQ